MRDAPHHRIGDVEMLGQHVRPGHQAVNQEGAEQDRHAGAGRHAEHDRRHQRAAFAGIGRAFGRDHAAHVAVCRRSARRPSRCAARGRRRSSRSPTTPMPGIAPMTEPIQEQRRIRNQCVKQSLIPSQHAGLGVDASGPAGRRTCATRAGRRAPAARRCRASPAPAAGRPRDRGCPSSSAACRSADRSRSSPASCRSRPRSGRAAACCRTATETMEMPNTAMRQQFGRADEQDDRTHDRQGDAISAAPNSPPISADM